LKGIAMPTYKVMGSYDSRALEPDHVFGHFQAKNDGEAKLSFHNARFYFDSNGSPRWYCLRLLRIEQAETVVTIE